MESTRFFVKDDIENELLCYCCQLRFSTPKNLPCGNCICSTCETLHFDSEEAECPLCFGVHEVPTEGFPVNKLIEKLLAKSTVFVDRGELHKNASSTVEQIVSSCDDFKKKIKDTNLFVKTYCDIVRSNVETKTDSVLESIKNHRDQLLAEIKAYENKCLVADHNLEGHRKFVDDFEEKRKSWVTLLNRPASDETVFRNILTEVSKLNFDLAAQQRDFEALAFDKEKLQFSDTMLKVDANIIGILSTAVLPENSFESMLREKPCRINFSLKSELPEYYKNYVWEIQPDKYFIARMVIEQGAYFILLSVYDINGALLQTCREGAKDTFFKAAKVADQIIVGSKSSVNIPNKYCQNCGNVLSQNGNCPSQCSIYGNNRNRCQICAGALNHTKVCPSMCISTVESYALKTYSHDLKIISTNPISYEPTTMVSDDKQLFVYSASNQTLYAYDVNLSPLKISILAGQTDAFKHINAHFSIHQGIIFAFTGQKLILYDTATSKELKTVSKNKYLRYLFQVVTNDIFALMSLKGDSFLLVDANLNKLIEFKLENTTAEDITHFSITENGNLLVMDAKDVLQIFKKKALTVN